MSSGRIKGITVEIGGDTTGLTKALKSVDSTISKTQSSLRDVNRLLKLDPTNTELLTQKQKLLKDAVSQTKERLEALKTASEQAGKTVKNYDAWKAAYTPIQQEIDKTKNKIADLKSKMAEMEKAGEIDTSEYKELQKQLEESENHLKDLKQQAKEVSDEFGNPISTEQYDALQREIVATEQKLKSLEEEEKNFGSVASQKVAALGNKFAEAGAKIESAGKKVAPASAATAAIGAAAVKTATDFESGMLQVAATMGMTTAEINKDGSETQQNFQKLSDAARKMGEETQFSATDAADALNYLALAGYDTDKAIETIPTILNLAAAGNIDLASASDMVTDAMSALGLETDQAEEFVDQMAVTSQKSNTDVAQLGEAILTVGGTAKTMAGGVTEMNTALGILADSGIKGSEGGTALRNILLSLSAPTDTAAEKMQELGLQVFDAEGNMRPLNDTFNDLNGILSTMTQGEQTQVLNELFNKTDLASVNALLANSGQRFDELSGYISDSDGAAQEMADTLNSGLNGQLSTLKSQMSEAAISIGNALLPIIKDFVSFLQQLMDKFNSLSPQMQTAIAVIGSIVAAIGPVLIIIGKMSTGVGAIMKLCSNILPVITGVGGAIAGLGAPVLIAIGVIAALVAVGVLLYKNWDTIKAKAIEIFQAVADWIGQKIESIKSFFTGLWTSMQAIWDNICNVVQVAIMLIGEIISAAFQIITLPFQLIWQNCKDVIIGAWDAISSKVSSALSAVASVIRSVMSAIQSVISTIWNAISSKVSSAVNAIKSVVSSVFNAVKSVALSVWNSIKSIITTVVDGIKSKISSVFNSVKSTVSSVFNSIKSTATSVWNSIKSAITTPIEAAKNAVKSAIDKMKSFFNFTWSLPKIKLPHFSITGSFSLNPPSVPHFSISWYKKAMNGALLLTNPTLFGMAGGNLLGGGDAGNEYVVGQRSLEDSIRNQVDAALSSRMENISSQLDTLIAQVAAGKNIYLDKNKWVGATAGAYNSALGEEADRANWGY